MQDFGKLGKEIFSGANGNTLKSIMNSPDAQKLSKTVDTKAVEKAAATGDMAALQGLLAQVLSTDEGRKLAAQVTQAMNKGK